MVYHRRIRVYGRYEIFWGGRSLETRIEYNSRGIIVLRLVVIVCGFIARDWWSSYRIFILREDAVTESYCLSFVLCPILLRMPSNIVQVHHVMLSFVFVLCRDLKVDCL